jgi:hypothetical protein
MPEDLYLHPKEYGTHCYATKIDENTEELMEGFEDDLAFYDLYTYQTPQFATICEEILRQGNITYSFEDFEPGLDTDHVRAYDFLRTMLRRYEQVSGEELFQLEPPRGGLKWIEKMRGLVAEADEQRRQALFMNP